MSKINSTDFDNEKFSRGAKELWFCCPCIAKTRQEIYEHGEPAKDEPISKQPDARAKTPIQEIMAKNNKSNQNLCQEDRAVSRDEPTQDTSTFKNSQDILPSISAGEQAKDAKMRVSEKNRDKKNTEISIKKIKAKEKIHRRKSDSFSTESNDSSLSHSFYFHLDRTSSVTSRSDDDTDEFSRIFRTQKPVRIKLDSPTSYTSDEFLSRSDDSLGKAYRKIRSLERKRLEEINCGGFESTSKKRSLNSSDVTGMLLFLVKAATSKNVFHNDVYYEPVID